MKAKIVWGARGKRTYFLGDAEVTKEEFDQACPTKIEDLLATGKVAGTLMETSAAWPRKSDALGCHPKQKAAMEERYRKLGVPTEIDAKDGQAIIRNNAHQRDLQKALGMHNNHAGYGSITG